MNKYFVYVYLDPFCSGTWKFENLNFEFKPFYIGMGSGRRHLTHLAKSDLDNTYNTIKTRKIKKILNNNSKPIILKLFVNLDLNTALDIETKMIKHFGKICDKSGILTNILDSGVGVFTKSGKDNHKTKIIYQYDLTGNYIKKWNCGAREIVNILNLRSKSSIRGCCLGKIKKAYDSQWFYEYKGKKIKPYIIDYCPNGKKKIYSININNKKIREFNSIAAASKFYGIYSSNIIEAAQKNWRLQDFYFSYDGNFLLPDIFRYKYKKLTFKSLAEISRKFDLTKHYCQKFLKEGKIKKFKI